MMVVSSSLNVADHSNSNVSRFCNVQLHILFDLPSLQRDLLALVEGDRPFNFHFQIKTGRCPTS